MSAAKRSNAPRLATPQTSTPANGAASAAAPSDRALPKTLLALAGTKVTVTVKSGARFQGILAAATGEGELNIALRQATLIDDPSAPLKPSLLIQSRDLVELFAADVAFDHSRPALGERESFRTDTDISGVPFEKREKELQAWGGGGGADSGADDAFGGLSLEDNKGSGRTGAWDQFAANERMYGTRTDYHEDLYTTKLDRSGADYRAREQRAAQLEREILKGSSLSSNAHMAEERGLAVDDSGLDEEDRYSGVIRGEGAYVPPGARKGHVSRFGASNGSTTPATPPPSLPRIKEAVTLPSRPSPAPAPAAASAPAADTAASKQPAPTDAAAGPPAPKSQASLEVNFRQFVSAEKERLVQKRQAVVKAAERKDQDTRLASLLEFSQNFKLKTPMPADVASLLGRDPSKKSESVSTATSPVQSPVRPPRALTPAATPVPAPATSTTKPGAKSPTSIIAEIPPFKPKAKPTSPTPAPAAKPPTASTSKINPNAPAFVFKPNPNASSFTPSFAASPSRKPAEQPINPFFGSKQPKKGSSSMHVKEDFDPFKHGVVREANSIVAQWTFTGKSYFSMFPAIPSPTGRAEDDSNGAPVHHVPPPPPPPFGVYQQYQPTFNRFQPPQGQGQQGQQVQMQMPPGGMQFQPYPGMPFPPPGPHGAPMFNPSPQMQPQMGNFVRYPQFQPGQPNAGVPMGGFVPQDGRPMAGP
ncbi:Pab1 binding protein [Pseudohyphozyma bogoriensis]|nr:Pab1 binding protein [Pseudohyphozyma bogoriensis]